jgi:hypothetical protein
MTMQPNHHPDEERLAAFADGHPDLELRLHLRDCGRCRSIVDELTMLRAALAELPDLAPSRPLRLLPEVPAPEPSAAERLAGWTRRAFMPLLAAGFGLAIVGSVGTLGSSFTLGGASGAAPAFVPVTAQSGASSAPRDAVGGAVRGATPSPSSSPNSEYPAAAAGGSKSSGTPAPAEAGDSASETPAARALSASPSPTADRVNVFEQSPPSTPRSLWPMVLFAGVALIVATLLLRWIIQPRAG